MCYILSVCDLLRQLVTFSFLSSPKDVFTDFFRGSGRERERNIDWLPPVHAPTGDLTAA